MPARPRPAIAAIASATLATLIVGSVTAVQAANAPKPVKACADKLQNLKLKTSSGCPKGTHGVALGQQGPAGTPGAKGVAGDRGPSDLYVAYASDVNVSDGADHTVASLALPVGYYSLTASAEFVGDAGKDLHPYCWFNDGTNNDYQTNFAGPYNATGYGGLTVTDAIAVLSPRTVSLICDIQGLIAGGTIAIAKATVQATAAGAMHVVSGTSPLNH